jgi:hypothetical protein
VGGKEEWDIVFSDPVYAIGWAFVVSRNGFLAVLAVLAALAVQRPGRQMLRQDRLSCRQQTGDVQRWRRLLVSYLFSCENCRDDFRSVFVKPGLDNTANEAFPDGGGQVC